MHIFPVPDSGVCYDDDADYCKKVVKEDKCTDGALPQYGNHCKKSCGLCGKYTEKNQPIQLNKHCLIKWKDAYIIEWV